MNLIIFRWFLLISFCFAFVSQAHANEKCTNYLNIAKKDFIQHMSQDWKDYKVTEFFSQKKDYSYLDKTFGKQILSLAINTESTEINIEQKDNTEGGFDLGIINIKYNSKEAAQKSFDIINNSKLPNLKGGKIFIGFTAKQCKNSVILIHSKAVLTNEIKGYFKYFESVFCETES